MRVKCFRCKEYFSSGECVQQNVGSGFWEFWQSTSVWLCHSCHEEQEKEVKERNKLLLKQIPLILLGILGIWFVIAFIITALNGTNRFLY